MKLRFITGQRLKFTCSRCNAKREGRVYRDTYAWRIRFHLCGHEKEIGLTAPMDILEAQGLIET